MVSADRIQKLFPVGLRKRLPHEVAVVCIGENESRRLNRRYRKKGKPTNVLSFRYDSGYGEILVCLAVIRREAKKQGNSYNYQMTWMIVHGMIHLAGIHHESSKKRALEFERSEQKILKSLK